ncbi:MAG: hypothetical protein ACYC6F_11755 [Longimicrobiales bacterium]
MNLSPSVRRGAVAVRAAVLGSLAVASPLAAQTADGPVFTIDATLGSLFDSNVHRRPDPTSVYGLGGQMLFRLATSQLRPLLTLQYAPAFRTSSAPTRYDGPGYDVAAVASVPLGERLRVNVLGAKSRGGVDEDMNPTDQVMVRVAADLFLGSTRLRAFGAHRWRELGDALLPAIGQYVAAELEQKLTRSTTLAAEWRYEQLEPQDTTRLWKRHAFEAGVTQEIGSRLALELEARRRWREYPYRIVDEDEEPLVHRKDLDWRFGGALIWDVSQTTGIDLDYEIEQRESTDDDRAYGGHRIGITIRQRLHVFGGRR